MSKRCQNPNQANQNDKIFWHKFHLIFFWPLIFFLSACSSNTPKSFLQLISVKPDTLQIDNTKDTLIFGSKGTALFFEKGSFQLPDGTAPSGKISILVKECYNNADIVRENLSTTSGRELLETRGMINVSAFSNDRELKFKKGKKFIIHFPKDSSDGKKKMNLFYGKNSPTGTMDWKLDSVTLLKPTAFISGWSTTGDPGGDTASVNAGLHIKGQKADSIFNYFYKNFDDTKLKIVPGGLQGKFYTAKFVVNRHGNITNVKIVAGDDIFSTKVIKPQSKIGSYLYKFVEQIPPLDPFYRYDDNHEYKPFDADCSISISFGYNLPDYRDNDNYNKIFNKKYRAFKKSAITSMNEAELNYYIFSAAKLGWINCDFFWQVLNEKIDYYVKADAKLKPNIKLIFKQAKSILEGTPDGDKYVFKNVPVNQEIKIVAITFEGSKPLMAIGETKTSKQPFEKLDYKTFTISDLEKQLNTPQ